MKHPARAPLISRCPPFINDHGVLATRREMSQTGDVPKAVRVDARSLDRAIADLIRHRVPKQRPSGWQEISDTLREVLSHHSGSLPPRAIMQIWSNILFASDGEGALHVFGGDNRPGFWDLARVHFGCAMPMTSHATPAAVVHACAADRHAIGVLPEPESEEAGQGWWEQLVPPGHQGPRIVQSLPFVRDDGGESPLPRGFAIASVPQDATGRDATLLRFECQGELSRTRLQSLLRQAGFEAQVLSASRAASGNVASRILIAARGHIAADDERLAAITDSASDAIGSVALVGGLADSLDAGPAGSA